MNNFIYTLVNYLKHLNLDYPVSIGAHPNTASLTITPADGSEVLCEYMNGMADVRLPFEISIKDQHQEKAHHTLKDILYQLSELGSFLTTENKHFILNKLDVTSVPQLQEKTNEYFQYKTKITVNITVK